MRTKTTAKRAAILTLAAAVLLTFFGVFTSQANAAETYEEKLQKYAYGDSKFSEYYPTDFSKNYAPTGSDLFYAEKFYNDYYLTQDKNDRVSVRAYSDGYIRGIFESGVDDNMNAFDGSISNPTQYNGMIMENVRAYGDSAGIRFQDVGMEFTAAFDGKSCKFQITYGTLEDVINGTASGYKYNYFVPQDRTDAKSKLNSYTLTTVKYETLLQKMALALNAQYGTSYTVDSIKKSGWQVSLRINSFLTIVDPSLSGVDSNGNKYDNNFFNLDAPELIGDITESKSDASVTIARRANAGNRTAQGQNRVWTETANYCPVIANSYDRGNYGKYNRVVFDRDHTDEYDDIAAILGKIYDVNWWGDVTSANFEKPGMYFNIRTTLTQPPSVYYVSGLNKTALETGMRIPTTGAQTHRNASFEAIVGGGTTLDAVKVTCLTNNKTWTSTSETISITDLPAGEHKYKVEATSHVPNDASLAYKTEYIITISVAPHYTVTFDPNGGAVKPTAKSVTYSEAYGTLPTPTRAGYSFTNWYTGKTSGTSVSATTTVTMEGDHTLYARWTPRTDTPYTVNHYTQDLDRAKTGVADTYSLYSTETKRGTSDSTVKVDGLKKNITGFTYKEGKVNGVTQTTTTILPDGSRVIDLYYTRNTGYKVELTAGTGISSTTGSGTYPYGATVTIDADVRNGYTWHQWAEGYASELLDLNFEVSSYGRWYQNILAVLPTNTSEVVINFPSDFEPEGVCGDSDGPSSEHPYEIAICFDGGDGEYIYRAIEDSIVVPVPSGSTSISISAYSYDRDYWRLSFEKLNDITVSATYASTKTFAAKKYTIGSVQRDISYTANATVNGYTVTFDPNGGMVSPTTKSVTFDAAYGELPTPVRDGYSFAGWFTSASEGTQVTETSIVKTAKNHTLYAHWTGHTDTAYTVRHFTQDLDKDKTGVAATYTLYSTEDKTGTSGATVTLAKLKKDIAGFTYKEGKVNGAVVATTTIAVDGSRVIDLYYTRNTGYKLTLTAGTGIDSVSGAGSYPYGATVPINAAVKAGYTWSKWTGAAQLTAKNTAVTVTANASYTANATANRYTVTFNPNGGTVSPTTKSVTFNATYGELPTPTRVGYTFAGWYTARTGGAKVTATTVVKTAANHTLYAHWVARGDIAYTVRHFTQDLNAAKTGVANTYSLHSTDALSGTSGATLTLANLKKSITGFTYKEGKVDGNVVTTTTVAPDGSLVIDLYYSRNTGYKVVLTAGTGISATTGSGIYPYGATVTIDATVRSGYSWYRWTVTSTGSLAYSNKSWTLASIQGNVSYTANATANKYTVTFDPNGGKVSPTSKSVTFASVYGELPTPTRPGYDFKGWYTAKTEGYQVSENTMVAIAGNHTLYARWTARNDTPYVVNHYTQDLNADKTGVADTYSLHSTDKRTGTSDAVLTLSNLKKDIAGFTYKEGKVGGNAVTKTTIAPDGSRVIDLYYSRNVNCRIDLVAGTGISATTGSGTYPYGATVSIDATVKTGYTWSRWTITATGAQAFTEKTRILSNIQGSTSYTANATPSKYIVTFNPNGGTVDPETKTVTFDAPYGELPTPARNNFIFEGWYTERRGGTRVDASTVVTTAGNHTLYAQWTPAADMLINDFGDITGVTFGLTKYMSLGGAVYDYKDDCTVDGEPQKGLAITFTTMPMKGHYVKAWIRLLGDTYNCTWSDGQTVTTVEGDGRVVIPGKLRGVHRNVTMELIVESYTDANCTQLASRETRNCLVNTDTVAPDIAFEYNRYSKKAAISVTDQIVGVKSASYDLMFKDGGGVYDQAINNSVTITIDKAGKVVITATDLLDNQVSKSFDASPAPDEEERPGTDVDPDDEPDPHDPSKYPAGTKYWKTRHFYCYLINGNS